MTEVCSLDDYQRIARETAVYPLTPPAGGLVYCILGLNGEASEVVSSLIEYEIEIEWETEARRDHIQKELGDVSWYLAMSAHEAGLLMSEIADAAVFLMVSAPHIDDAINNAALNLNAAAGHVAELVKKLIRDDGGELTQERRADIKRGLGSVLWAWHKLCGAMEFPVDEVLNQNIEKLRDRKKRNRLQGDGDQR